MIFFFFPFSLPWILWEVQKYNEKKFFAHLWSFIPHQNSLHFYRRPFIIISVVKSV